MMPSCFGYDVVRKLGEGANGPVFEVNKDNKKYAMKVVGKADKYDIQEAEILKGVNHPNVIKYVDSFQLPYECFGKMETTVIIAMECADKGPLSTQNLNMSELMVWDFMAQFGSGLSYLHGQGIIHRDLKPANILCFSTRGNKVVYKISDLGIAKRFDLCTKSRLYANTIIGTFCYMAPEVLNGLPYTWSADSWSFGAVICFLCNDGVHLFRDSKEVYQPIIDPLPNRFSPRLKGSVLRLLKINPKDRSSANTVFKEATNAITDLSFTLSRPFLAPSPGQPPNFPTNQVIQPIGQPTNQRQPTFPISSNISHPISGIPPNIPLAGATIPENITHPYNNQVNQPITHNLHSPSRQTSHIPYLASGIPPNIPLVGATIPENITHPYNNQVNQSIGQPTNQPQPTLPIPANISHPTFSIFPGQPTPLLTYPFFPTNNRQPILLIPPNISHPISGIPPNITSIRATIPENITHPSSNIPNFTTCI